MKTVTKYENLKEKEVAKIYESISRNEDEGVEMLTYGIEINDIIFNDLSLEKDVVKNLVNLINKTISGDNEAKDKLHEIIVSAISSAENYLSNL